MKIVLRAILSVSLVLAAAAACAPGVRPRPQEAAATPGFGVEAMLDELDAARTDPRAYARRAREFRALFRGDRFQRPGEIAVVTQEGVSAVDEAIRFLEAQPPLPPLGRSAALDRSAAEHGQDQGRTGEVGHQGSDGSSPNDRMRRHGRWQTTAEAIAYGPTPEQAIMQLIVDDGVPDRGHRTILFSPAYRMVGAWCGPHPRWRTVCVLNFATPASMPSAL